MTRAHLKYEIVIENELLTASGLALPGVFDGISHTDRFDFPKVPRRTVKGLLRAQVERICPSISDRIFGHGGGEGAQFIFSDASVPYNIAERLTDPRSGERCLGAMSQRDRTRIALKPDTGTVRDKHMFANRYALALVPLQGEIWEEPEHMDKPCSNRRRDVAALLLALRTMAEIGSDRRRGPGACRVQLITWPHWVLSLDPTCADWQALAETVVSPEQTEEVASG